jgi:hypothetical protein
MFTRFTLAEIDATAPSREVMQQLRDGNERDQALYTAVDALRNLARVRRLLESEARGS